MALTFDPTATSSGAKTPLGEYLMTLTSVKVDETPNKFDNGTQRLVWEFSIDSVESLDDQFVSLPAASGEGYDEYELNELDDDQYAALVKHLSLRTHKEWSNNTMGANSTTREWLNGMNGKPIDKAVTSDQFEGKQFKVTLGWKSYVIQSTGTAGTKRTITSIRPHKAAGTRRRAAAPVEDVVDDTGDDLF